MRNIEIRRIHLKSSCAKTKQNDGHNAEIMPIPTSATSTTKCSRQQLRGPTTRQKTCNMPCSVVGNIETLNHCSRQHGHDGNLNSLRQWTPHEPTLPCAWRGADHQTLAARYKPPLQSTSQRKNCVSPVSDTLAISLYLCARLWLYLCARLLRRPPLV